jgi:hypothetical protein
VHHPASTTKALHGSFFPNTRASAAVLPLQNGQTGVPSDLKRQPTL